MWGIILTPHNIPTPARVIAVARLILSPPPARDTAFAAEEYHDEPPSLLLHPAVACSCTAAITMLIIRTVRDVHPYAAEEYHDEPPSLL